MLAREHVVLLMIEILHGLILFCITILSRAFAYVVMQDQHHQPYDWGGGLEAPFLCAFSTLSLHMLCAPGGSHTMQIIPK